MKAWKWQIDYSIKYKDGKIDEKYGIVEASSCAEALAKAFVLIETPARLEENVKTVKIWNVGIITRSTDPAEVFEEAENNGI